MVSVAANNSLRCCRQYSKKSPLVGVKWCLRFGSFDSSLTNSVLSAKSSPGEVPFPVTTICIRCLPPAFFVLLPSCLSEKSDDVINASSSGLEKSAPPSIWLIMRFRSSSPRFCMLLPSGRVVTLAVRPNKINGMACAKYDLPSPGVLAVINPSGTVSSSNLTACATSKHNHFTNDWLMIRSSRLPPSFIMLSSSWHLSWWLYNQGNSLTAFHNVATARTASARVGESGINSSSPSTSFTKYRQVCLSMPARLTSTLSLKLM